MSLNRALGIMLLLDIWMACSANANPLLEKAGRHYAKREEKDHLRRARSLYSKVLKGRYPLEDKRLALWRYTKLAELEGHIGKNLFQRRSHDSAKIFARCEEAAKHLSPVHIGEHVPEYYYARAACLLFTSVYSKNCLTEDIISLSTALLDLISYGREHFPDFGGGAFFRIHAELFLIRGGALGRRLYWPEISLQYIDRAIDRWPQNHHAFLIKAKALARLGKNNEAISLGEQRIFTLKAGVIKDGLGHRDGIEALATLHDMKRLVRRWKRVI